MSVVCRASALARGEDERAHEGFDAGSRVKAGWEELGGGRPVDDAAADYPALGVHFREALAGDAPLALGVDRDANGFAPGRSDDGEADRERRQGQQISNQKLHMVSPFSNKLGP